MKKQRVPVCELEAKLGESVVEQLVSLLSSLMLPMVSESDGRIDDSLPLETAYTVQKFGVHSEILDDKLRPLIFSSTQYNVINRKK